MNNTYEVCLVSDSTGETLDRIFLALKAQFKNTKYKTNQYSFTRTENQVLKIIDICKKKEKPIILYTIVDIKLAKFLTTESEREKIPCFGVLGDLILSFSKLLKQKASHIPSGQHILNEEYYQRIEAIQFTMNHDDGNLTEDIEKNILRELSRYKSVVESAAIQYEPHQLAYYLRDLATQFHSYYNACTFILDDQDLTQARLSLIHATRHILLNGLSILGVDAPESM